MNTIEHTMTWRVEVRPAIPLAMVPMHKELRVRGVYFILEGPQDGPHNPQAEHVIYIGKAIAQTIHKRGCIHLDTMTDARRANGNAKTGNSRAFKAYRTQAEFDHRRLWFVAGEMNPNKPWLISCAEGFLIHEFERRHGRKPKCNTNA